MSYHSDVFIGDDDGEGGDEEDEEEVVYEEVTRLAHTHEARRRQKDIPNTHSSCSSRGSGGTPVGERHSAGAESSPRPCRSSRKPPPAGLGWGLHGLYARLARIFHRAWREVRFRGESLGPMSWPVSPWGQSAGGWVCGAN